MPTRGSACIRGYRHVAEDQQDVGSELDISLAAADRVVDAREQLHAMRSSASRSRASTWSASPPAVSSTVCVSYPICGPYLSDVARVKYHEEVLCRSLRCRLGFIT
jgi:hypothetical protein